jgi:hypothetical protein
LQGLTRRLTAQCLETLLLAFGAGNFLYFSVVKFKSFDNSQRAALGIAFLSLAFLIAQIVYNRRVRETTEPAPPNGI